MVEDVVIDKLELLDSALSQVIATGVDKIRRLRLCTRLKSRASVGR